MLNSLSDKIYNPECIIFDCDGVLVDSVAISNRVLVAMLQEYGSSERFEDAIDNFQSGSLLTCLQEIERIIERPLPDTFVKNFREKTFEAFRKELKPVAGAKELIDKLSVPYCVASSGPLEKIRLNLTLTDLLNKFEYNIFSSYEINSWKPSPEIFIHAASQMGFEPNKCVVIEDSFDGIRAAIDGGFIPFALTTPRYRKRFEKMGAHTFYSLEEIAQVLAPSD